MAGYDLAIVGAGILGLAHALAAARLGKSVVVIDRDPQARGASVRNFGFITVTGQAAGDCWRMARRSREVWLEVAEAAGIPVLHRGLLVTVRRPEAEAVVEAFLETDMAEGCRRLSTAEAARHVPDIRRKKVTAALYSPLELRVESRAAVPALQAWLKEHFGVAFQGSTHVHEVGPGRLETSRGPIEAEAIVICPGDEFQTLFPERIRRYGTTRCLIHMLRLEPERPVRLGAAVMSDLGLARYHGYADLPAAAPLKARLDAEQPAQRQNGVHLIVVQSADGSLVVGDSHHYGEAPDPFYLATVEQLILEEMEQVLDLGGWRISERWLGTYASAEDRWRLTDAPDERTRIVIVTAGCGASTAFAIGEETIRDLFG